MKKGDLYKLKLKICMPISYEQNKWARENDIVIFIKFVDSHYNRTCLIFHIASNSKITVPISWLNEL